MRTALLTVFTLVSHYLYAQEIDFTAGARHTAMGGTSTTLVDGWSLFNNIGGLGGLRNSQGFVSYVNRYSSKAFQSVAAGYTHSFSAVNSGISFYRFGDEHYSHQRIGIGIGNRFQMVSLGMSINFIQYRIETQGIQNTSTVDFGGVVEILPQLHLGAFASNLFRAQLESGEPLPFIMRSGVSVRPTSELKFNLEIEKDIDLPASTRFGLEYVLQKIILLRTGFNTNPRTFTVGFGVHPGPFMLDYAYEHKNELGALHEFSIAYHLHRNEG